MATHSESQVRQCNDKPLCSSHAFQGGNSLDTTIDALKKGKGTCELEYKRYLFLKGQRLLGQIILPDVNRHYLDGLVEDVNSFQ